MSRDKQIEEMAKDICHLPRTCDECEVGEIDRYICQAKKYAERAYNAGYRKVSDIFEEIEETITAKIIINGKIIYDPLISLAELKKKYESEDFIPAPPHTCAHIIPHTIESIANLAFPESEGEG